MRSETDRSLAVGTAKDFVDVLKNHPQQPQVRNSQGADLSKIVQLIATELKLVPDGISEAAREAEAIRSIFRNLATLTQGLSELRGLYCSRHGRDSRNGQPSPGAGVGEKPPNRRHGDMALEREAVIEVSIGMETVSVLIDTGRFTVLRHPDKRHLTTLWNCGASRRSINP